MDSLVESYVHRGERPIRWLVVADGDAGSQVRQAFAHAQVKVPFTVIQAIGHVGSEMALGVEHWAKAVRALNVATRRRDGASFMLLPVDLEHAALRDASAETRQRICERIGCLDFTHEGLLHCLGSKASNTVANSPVKHPWVRGLMGETLPWLEVSDDIRAILQRWLEGAVSPRKARQLLKAAS